MGIGLNSGDVISGQCRLGAAGSSTRRSATRRNTASRLEGMTKGTPHSVFISDTTVALLQEQVEDLVFVDEMEVRGRQAKVKLWSLPVGVKTTTYAN